MLLKRSKHPRSSRRADPKVRRLGIEHLEDRRLLAIVTWDGGGDNSTWGDRFNWSGDTLPNNLAEVQIDVPGSAVTIRHSNDVTTIKSLACEEALTILSGSITVLGSSHVNGALTVSAGATLAASGVGALFTAAGTTVIDGSNLSAFSGGTISLPNVTSYSKGGGFLHAYFQANGVGSLVNLPGLTSLSGLVEWLHVFAQAGGRVSLPQLTSVTNSFLEVSADGIGVGNVPSTVDLSALTSFNDTNGSIGYLQAVNGGRVIDPLLTTTNTVNITVGSGGSQMNTSQLASVNRGSISVSQNANFSGLTNIDSASLYAYSGATLSLPNVTSYSKGGGFLHAYFQANGVGSLVDLPGLTSLSGLVEWLHVFAQAGGRVSLPQLTSVTNSFLEVSADGIGVGNVPSTVDLSALTSFNDTNGSIGYLQAVNGGRVIDPLLTTTNTVNITVGSGGSQMNTSQLASVNRGSISVSQNANFSGLTNIDSASLYAYSGATLSLPNVTSYSKGGGFLHAYFQANGVGSLVDLPGLTSLSGLVEWLHVFAQAGGRVSLPQLTSVTNSFLEVSADGIGVGNVPSTVDLSALTSFNDTNGSIGYLQAVNGGRVIDPLLTTTNTVNITVGSGGSQMNTSQLASVNRGSISVSQNANFSGLTNIDSASLYAYSGATLSLPNVTSYSKGGGFLHAYFQANGVGSLVDLPGLTSLSGLVEWLHVFAQAGGRVSLPQLTSVTNSFLEVSADGIGVGNVPSTVDLSALTSFNDTNGSIGYLQAVNGGRVIDPLLTTTNTVNITVGSGGSQMNTSQLASVNRGSISVSQNANFSGLTNIDSASLYAYSGATLSLPNVTSYSKGGGFLHAYFQANGVGSLVDLPGLTSLSGLVEWLHVFAQAGGRVSLPQLTSVTNSFLEVSADGIGVGNVPSTVDLSALTSFNDTNGSIGYLQAVNGGRVIDPLLTTTNTVNITVGSGGSQMNTSQLASVNRGSISVSQNANFSGLTNIDSASLYAYSGATLSLPNVTSYSKGGGFLHAYFQANGVGSLVDLPGLTSLSGLVEWLHVFAQAGGRVSLPQLTSVTNSFLEVSADGIGVGNVPSTVDLSALTSFNDTNGSIGYLQAVNGGTILTVSHLVTTGVSILFDSTLTIQPGQRVTTGNRAIDVHGNLVAGVSVINRGEIVADASVGRVTLSAQYRTKAA